MAEEETSPRAGMPGEADDRFVAEYRPLVVDIASKLRSQLDLRSDLDDLIAFGFTGLLQARNRFDGARGVQFNTFAYYRVRGAIIDGVRKMAWLPRRAHRKLRVAEAVDQLAEETGAQRSAAKGQGSIARSEALRSVDRVLGKISASFVVSCVGPAKDTPDAEEQLLAEEQSRRVRDLVVALPDRERQLVEGFYFHGRRFDEVADELGISKSWASRLHSKALELLKKSLTEDG